MNIIIMIVAIALFVTLFGRSIGNIERGEYPRTMTVKKGRDIVLGIIYLACAVLLTVTAVMTKGA